MSTNTFTDKLGNTGRTGDRVIVPVCGDDGMPQLAIAVVVDLVVRKPNPFASELSVRTRVGNDESCIYEPDEVVLLTDAGHDIATVDVPRTTLLGPKATTSRGPGSANLPRDAWMTSEAATTAAATTCD